MSRELALMGVTEIHRRIGGSRGRVRQMAWKRIFRPDRSAPPGQVWVEAEAEAWIRRLPAEEIDPSPMAG